MKYLFFLALLCTACKQTSKNCNDFKTGTFVYEEDNGNYKFVRTADTQTETNLRTGEVTILNVSWQDECTYTLAYREGYKPRELTNPPKQVVKIIKTAGEYMYYEASIEGHGNYSGKLHKVK